MEKKMYGFHASPDAEPDLFRIRMKVVTLFHLEVSRAVLPLPELPPKMEEALLSS
uniref:Uncharacterized protein n=1 Tax=Lepeophtheirus salmonis TaxID=72036 RepID=A0A0K2V9P7_LEPSM